MLPLDRPDLIRKGSYVDGQWLIGATDQHCIEVLNPASGDVLASLPSHDEITARMAIDAASEAFSSWRQTSVKDRARYLKDWFALILENELDLAKILTAEQGKPLGEARGEIAYGASYLEWFAEEAKRIDGDLIPPPTADRRLMVTKNPVGVVASITPWNFPSAMVARKAAPALAAGCTFVAKPALETPLSALALAYLSEEAGIPAGVFNVVVGRDAAAIGQEMTSSSHVKKLTFTGSTAVGKHLLALCAPSCKRTTMELGGNAPFIVFSDADLDKAVSGAIASKYRNSGQTCICSNRILVHADVYDEFVEKLCRQVERFSLGDGSMEGTTHGPLISEKAVRNVAAIVEDAIAGGGRVAIGGGVSDKGPGFFEPTVLTNVNRDMRVWKEEIFGPVAPVFKFATEEEALSMANDTEFGLAAYFYTRDMDRVFRFSDAMEFGMVGINETMISNEMAPFGGVKESGFGREGSKYGITDYLELKYVCLGA